MSRLEAFYEELDPDRRRLAFGLREVVMASAPDMEERLAYGIPFFYRNKRICYLSPNKKGMYLGFTHGHLLVREGSLLRMEGRKQVASVSYTSVEDIGVEALSEVLQEALLLDELGLKEGTKPLKS